MRPFLLVPAWNADILQASFNLVSSLSIPIESPILLQKLAQYRQCQQFQQYQALLELNLIQLWMESTATLILTYVKNILQMSPCPSARACDESN